MLNGGRHDSYRTAPCHRFTYSIDTFSLPTL
ncbi:hypothetical protein SAMN05216557_101448 [Sphingomonas carotinifaciens]|uniref:Uncharacterized protein n=1 Tax=Sphingomonas carotinifaciens TaxID=1166323 RepID=A0A1G7FKU1_9SPHN|nr:hypothetical protein [Sphingomonas carotinifaciens]SDE76459.1 hypothetical protein SAMN05216557_101448 [Sphingomonas carotinifaciens]